MALLFLDSFDHYLTADAPTKWAGSWAGATIVAGAGRRSGGCMRNSTAAAIPTLPLSPSGNTAIIGVAYRVQNAAAQQNIQVLSAGTAQVTVALNASGFVLLYRGTSGGTLLGTATTLPIATGLFNYLELKVVVHATAGSAIVRVNEAEVLNLAGINTANTGAAAWDSLQLQCANAGNSDYDDLYVNDGSGSAPLNTFLGDCRVDARYPTGAGATTGWTPSTGANWSCVDEATPNGDTDYVSTGTVPSTDTYALQDAPVAGALLYGVQYLASVRKSDAGTCTLAPVVRHAGTDNVGTAVNPATTYAYTRQVYATNPGTGAAWLEADFNNAEFGVKRTA